MSPTHELEQSEQASDQLPDHDYEDVLLAGHDLAASHLSQDGD